MSNCFKQDLRKTFNGVLIEMLNATKQDGTFHLYIHRPQAGAVKRYDFVGVFCSCPALPFVRRYMARRPNMSVYPGYVGPQALGCPLDYKRVFNPGISSPVATDFHVRLINANIFMKVEAMK